MLRSICRATVVACLLVACSGENEADPGDPATPADMMDAAGATMAPITTPAPLSDRDMEQFVAVLAEMKALGDELGDLGDATDLGKMGAGLAANAQAMAILRKHGFDNAMAFQRVSFNVGSAMAAAEMEGRSAELEASRAKMEQLKSSMSEEQYDMMLKSQEQAMGMITNQPDGNVALVKDWEARIKAATGN